MQFVEGAHLRRACITIWPGTVLVLALAMRAVRVGLGTLEKVPQKALQVLRLRLRLVCHGGARRASKGCMCVWVWVREAEGGCSAGATRGLGGRGRGGGGE